MESDTRHFIDSQNYEAWISSASVLWQNTSTIYVFSIIISVTTVFATFLLSRFGLPKRTCKMIPMVPEANYETTESTDENTNSDSVTSVILTKPSDLKQAQLREIKQEMTQQQLLEEKEIQRQQLAAIFELMREHDQKFGTTSMDEIRDQMKMYCG